ncbi:uncharacterized protein LOC106868777 [Octopus bimaculoides]|nr:uncharacterized protein LOC106868777 [Octopus bimaculoides]
MVAVLTGTRFIVEFEDHWKRINESNPSKENPWIKEWYMMRNKCKFPGVIHSPFNSYPDCVLPSEEEKRIQFSQDQYVEPAVHAAFTYARALKTAQKQLCGNVAGVCPALLNLNSKDFAEQYLKKVEFTYKTDERISSLASDRYAPYQKAKHLSFDKNGEIISPEFGVWNYNGMLNKNFRFRNVGSYSDGHLSLDTSKVFMYGSNRTTELPSLPTSLCPNATCQPCLGSFVDIKYFFRNGDVILTSFFSLHSKGDLPFSCGLFTTDSAQMQYLEAVLYAIDNLKGLFPSLLPGVKLGTLILDDCSSSSSAVSQISDLQHGRLKVVDSLTRSQLQPRTISGYLGLADTWLTVPLAETMDRLKRPFIGYTAMGYQMKPMSTNEFPFYLNPLQLHSTLMRILSQFLRNVGWKYVQVLYSEDSYGENGRMELVKEAAKYGICVVASHSIDKLQKSTELINALRRNPNAKPVVVLVRNKKSIRRILESIRAEAAAGEFTFIGLDSWGTSDHIVKGFENEADGTLIFRYKTAAIADFQNYLDSLDAQNHAHNPWFIEWFQNMFKCALTSADVLKHGQLCNATYAKSKITSSPWFELDPRVLFVTDAVYAFAHGLDSSLREVCGQNYSGVCSKFLTSRDSGDILIKNIKAARFRDENLHYFAFDKNGFGNIPFEIFNYNSKKYDLVGEYSLTNERFSLNENSLKLFGGASVTSVRPSCKEKCISCQYMSNEQPTMFIPGDLLIAAMFDIHSADQSPFVCGPMSVYGGFQNTEAFAFALDWVNRGLLSDVTLNNITLGGIAFDGCSTPARAKSITLNFHHGLLNTRRSSRFLKNLSHGSLKRPQATVKTKLTLGLTSTSRSTTGAIWVQTAPSAIRLWTIGLFDIHKKGPTPFSCGVINDEQGYQLVEAFNYAVDYVNSNRGIFDNILRGVTIGSLAVDVCQSPTKAGNIVTNLQNKNAHLFDNATNSFIDPADFQVYVGPFDSESSLRVADILTKLGIPQISYGATSAELSSDRYQFFSRTVPSDSKQARAFVSFLKRYQIKYVQLISTEDTIGRYGKEEFAKVAFENKICITQNVSLPRDEFLTQFDADVAINKLALQDETTVVVLFVTNPRLLLVSAEKNYVITSRFLFIATDKWGADPDMLRDLNKLLSKRQIVIFDVETADLPDFDKYLDTKSTRANNNKNWFNEYYEELYSCTTTSNASSRFPTTCSGTSYRTLPIAPKYTQDPYVLFVVNAVFAAAIGIHGALQNVCGRDYNIICDRFISSDQRPAIQRYILSSQFIDPGLQPFYYMKGSDDSIRGYHIYEPVETKQYTNIGSYNETDNLKLDARYNINWSSSCSATSCAKCIFPPSEPTHFMTMKSPNDLNLVAVFDIHFADDKAFNQCGNLNTASGFQHALAFFYAIRNVNKNTRNRLASSLQLGGVALDTCSLPVTLGLDVYSLLTGSSRCRKKGANEIIFPPASIVGFVPKASSNAVPIANMLRDYGIMTLSPSATTTKLSDQSIYPHFLRTVPPDDLQAKVMMDILKKMQWTYVSSVYSDNEYGKSAIQTFLKAADNDTAVCATKIISMPMNATNKEAKDIVERLNREAGARAVVLFLKDYQIRLLLQAAKDLDLVNRFVWIGSDTWGNNMYVVSNGLQETAAGAITIQIRSKVLNGFLEYVKQLTLEKHDGIPDDWFFDFYQDIHKCRLLFTDRAKNYDRICTKNEVITDDKIQQDAFIFHTVLAVEMIAIGLNNIKECRQDSTVSVASCLALQKNKNAIIYDSVRKSPWIDLHLSDEDIPSNFSFKFTESGYGDIGYDIMNYRFNIYKNNYEYVRIGSWVDSLNLNILDYRGSEYADIAIIPLSRCPVGSTCNCLNAKAEKVQQSTPQSDLLTSGEDKIYIDPETGAFVNLRSLPSIGERFSSVWGTIATTLAALGAFFSFCLFCYFILFYPFRGGTTILGFTLIIAITGLYLMVIPFVAHATPEVCSIRRVFLGFFYALAYAVLVVKLLDAYRNIDKEELKYKNLAQPCGLLLITLFIVAIQLMIAIQWLILQPPEVVNVPVAGMLYPRCAPHDFSDESLVISFVFIMFLLLVNVLIGSATWNNPNNCYESQWILGMVLLSIPVWIIWCLISTLSSYNVRDIAVAGGILVNATILLVVGPLNRLKLMKKNNNMQPSEKDDYYLYDSGLNDDDVFYGNGYNTGPRIRDYPAYPQ